MRSSCCQAELKVYSADEGTSSYTCWECGKPCDAAPGRDTELHRLYVALEDCHKWLTRAIPNVTDPKRKKLFNTAAKRAAVVLASNSPTGDEQ